jgi:hypothetical protein
MSLAITAKGPSRWTLIRERWLDRPAKEEPDPPTCQEGEILLQAGELGGGGATLKLCPDGTIWVNGRAACQDLEVVEGLRRLILGNSPQPKRMECQEAAQNLRQAIMLETPPFLDCQHGRWFDSILVDRGQEAQPCLDEHASLIVVCRPGTQAPEWALGMSLWDGFKVAFHTPEAGES